MQRNQKKNGKKTVIIGASPSPWRFSNKAAHLLKQFGHTIVPVGIKKGKVADTEILDISKQPSIEDVDTVTLYVNPTNQQPWYDYILQLSPQRIVFNPGTENPELAQMAKAKGITTINHCTLIMLRSGEY